MTVKDLSESEYQDFHLTYLSKASDKELNLNLEKNKDIVVDFFESIPEDNYSFKYADHKWTIKEVLQHIIDTERVFAYRALRISRNDKTALSGFDQDEFNPFSGANDKTKPALIADYIANRDNTISLFNSFSDKMLLRIGTASGYNLSTRATAFIIVGHENHHLEVLEERYL